LEAFKIFRIPPQLGYSWMLAASNLNWLTSSHCLHLMIKLLKKDEKEKRKEKKTRQKITSKLSFKYLLLDQQMSYFSVLKRKIILNMPSVQHVKGQGNYSIKIW